MNNAADFLSILEAEPHEKMVLRVRGDITTKTIEVNIEPTGIEHDEPVFITNDDLTEDPEHDLWQRKSEIGKTTSSQRPLITIASCYHIDLHKEPSAIDMAHFYKPSRAPIEQDSDPVFLNFLRKKLRLPFHDQVLINYTR